jgi:hypothetical protein
MARERGVLRLWPDSSRRPARRPDPPRSLISGQVSSRQAVIYCLSRSAARRAGTCTLHPKRCSSRSSPGRV